MIYGFIAGLLCAIWRGVERHALRGLQAAHVYPFYLDRDSLGNPGRSLHPFVVFGDSVLRLA